MGGPSCTFSGGPFERQEVIKGNLLGKGPSQTTSLGLVVCLWSMDHWWGTRAEGLSWESVSALPHFAESLDGLHRDRERLMPYNPAKEMLP